MVFPSVPGRSALLDHQELSATFSLRSLHLQRDLAVVHRWMNDPEVARYWKKAWPAVQVASYLRRQERCPHSLPLVGELDGIPMSYWELYRADQDALARYYPAREHDAGIHLLLGPAQCRGRGMAARLLRVVSSWQLDADPWATRVIAEPDVDNERSIRAFARAGFSRTTTLELPDKRAALMVRNKE